MYGFCPCCSVLDIALFLRKLFIKAQTVKGCCRHVARCCQQREGNATACGRFGVCRSSTLHHARACLWNPPMRRICALCARAHDAKTQARRQEKARARRMGHRSAAQKSRSRGVSGMLGKTRGFSAQRSQPSRGGGRKTKMHRTGVSAACRRIKRKRERILLSSPALLRLRPDAD